LLRLLALLREPIIDPDTRTHLERVVAHIVGASMQLARELHELLVGILPTLRDLPCEAILEILNFGRAPVGGRLLGGFARGALGVLGSKRARKRFDQNRFVLRWYIT